MMKHEEAKHHAVEVRGSFNGLRKCLQSWFPPEISYFAA